MSLVAEAAVKTRRAARVARPARNHPIAIHLLGFAAGILLPVMAIVTFMLIDTARLWRDDSLHDARLIVYHLNATIEVELQKAINVGQILATGLALDEPDHARFEAQARDAADRLGQNIVVRDLTGRQIINTAIPHGAPFYVSNQTALELDRLAATRNAPVVSDLRTGTVRGLPVVNVVVPVRKGSAVAWFISISLSPNTLGAILSEGLPARWIAGVIGRDGRLIGRSRDQDRYLGTINPGFFKIATAPEGVWSGTSREGIPIAGAYIRAPLSGWIISVAVPESILRAPARQALGWLSGLAVAALALSLVLGWLLSRRISSSIRDLVSRARELGEGRVLGDSRSSVTEVNDVTDALRGTSFELARRADEAGQSADAVLASEARFRGIFENAAVGVALIGLDGAYLLVNQRMCDIVGYRSEEMLTKTIKDITDPEDFEDNLARGRAVLAGESSTFRVEKRYVRKDGTTIWCGVTVSLRSDASGAPEYFIAIVRDITVRREAQAELRERLREIEALYDNAPVGLTVLDRDRRVLRMNQALAEMNGLSNEGTAGRVAWDIVPALKEALDPKIDEVLATGRTVEVEVAGESPDGARRFWTEKIYPIRQQDETATAIGIVMQEITERKQTEEHLRFLMRELSHRSKNLLAVIQAMASQTAKSVETVDAFRRRFGERLMGMAASHDLLVNRDWMGASVESLVRGQLTPFVDTPDPRVEIGGPEADLKSEAAEALGLALHELATNSVRYGALGEAGGKVTIAWEVYWRAPDPDTGRPERRFRMDWTEQTIVPVGPPNHKGFGRMVIEHTVEASLGGKVWLEFPPSGVRWRIDAPASCLAVPARAVV